MISLLPEALLSTQQPCTLNTTLSVLQLHTAVHFFSFISCKYNFIPWSLLSSSTSFSFFPSPSLFVFHHLSVKVSPGLRTLLAPTLAASLSSPPVYKRQLFQGCTVERVQPTPGIFMLSGFTYATNKVINSPN